ncbi:MAG TPA: DUF3108 domain-containing protein [Candidatus Binataceae bacterium]|nr:DUF3108 domain-containing protein [Candidatus Binataceae bacterium]
MAGIATKIAARRAVIAPYAVVAALLIASPAAPAAPTIAATPAPAIHAARKPALSAEPIPLPDGVKVPAYKAGPLPFHDGERLVFQASWLGIPAADAKVELHRDRKQPSMWTAEVWVQTNPLVDLLFRMRDYVRESFSVGTLAPHDMYIRQHENQRFNEYRVSFDQSESLVTLVQENHKGSQTRRFISANPSGPISGTMMALSQPLQPGGHLAFDVFTGSSRYVFDFAVGDHEQVSVKAGSFDAIRLTPAVVYESNGKMSKSGHDTRLWVSADPRHLPLRAEAAAFIGSVRADLVEIDDVANPAAK